MTFRLVDGGEKRITFVHPLTKWDDMSRIEKAIADLVKTMGPQAATLAQDLRELTVRSESSVIFRRPDLSLE